MKKLSVIILLGMLSTTGCDEKIILGDESGTPGYLAFKNGLYAWARDKGCQQCHGVAQSPRFATSNGQESYEEAKTRVDFENPTTSAFINHSGNGHCGLSICSGAENEATVEDLIISWANIETTGNPDDGGPPLPTYISVSVPIPPNLPGPAQAPAVMRFPLSQLDPPVPFLSNAVFEVEIQMWNSTNYRISRPKIGEITTAVSVTGIHVYVGDATQEGIGAEDEAQGDLWTVLSDISPIYDIPNYPPTLPNGPLGGANPPSGLILSMPSLFVEKHADSEKMTIGFELLEATVLPPQVQFADIVAIVNQRCRTCHTGIPQNPTPAQYQAPINLQGGGGTATLVVPGTLALSRLYMALSGVPGATNDMPQGQAPLPQADIDRIRNYILNL